MDYSIITIIILPGIIAYLAWKVNNLDREMDMVMSSHNDFVVCTSVILNALVQHTELPTDTVDRDIKRGLRSLEEDEDDGWT